jgi:hypothetical protein
MTKINQLYRAAIPYDLFVKLYRCFGYETLNIEYSFNKLDLEHLDTIKRVGELKDELSQFYIPCKAKLYLSNLNELKCITVFRQVLRLNNISLISKQKYIKHKKVTFYSIKFDSDIREEHLHTMKVNNNHLFVSFS